MTPVVFASRRCTMPWRSAAPLVATVYPAAARPPITVGPDQPGVGCAATPRGLSTTMMSSSSYRTVSPATARGGSTGGGCGSVTCSGSPARTRSDLIAGRPSRSTRPSPMSSAALDRDSPNILASAASSRSPSRPSGTASRRSSGSVIGPGRWWLRIRGGGAGAGAVQADTEQSEQDDQDAGADDGGVGQVEDRPVGQLDPVDDAALERAGGAEDPVEQVAGGPAEQQAQRDGPAHAAQVARGTQDVDDHADRDGGEHDGHRGADAERGASVADERDREQPAEQADRGGAGHPGDHDGLGDDVGGDDEPGHPEQEADSARARARGRGRGQRRAFRRWRVAFPVGLPQDSHTPYVPASIGVGAHAEDRSRCYALPNRRSGVELRWPGVWIRAAPRAG